MGSNTRTTKRTTIIDEAPDETRTLELAEDDDESSLRDFFAKLGAGAITFKVFQQTTKGPQYAFSGSDELDEDMIQEMYPSGGKFIVRVYRDGKYVSPTHSLMIAPRPIQLQKGPLQNFGGGSTADIQVQLLREQISREHEMVMALLAKERDNNGGMGIKDMIETMIALKGLAPESNIDLLMKGIELARDVGGGDGDWKTELLRAFKDVAPALPGLFASPSSGGAPALPAASPNPPQPQAQAPTPTQPQPQTQTPTQPATQPGTDMQLQIRMGIALLKTKCNQGVDPGFFVDQALVFADMPMYQRIISEIMRNDFDTFANMVDPEIGKEPYRAWFLKVYEGIREEFTDDETESLRNTMENHSTGESGDDSNASDNEGTSEPRDDGPHGPANGGMVQAS